MLRTMHKAAAMLLFAWLSAATQAAPPAGFQDEEIALWAAPAEADGVFDAHRADVAVNPASTMKLLTSWAALQQLGPNFRWRSEFRSSAPLKDGVLQGDLYWLGRGDPRLDSPRLAEMQRQLRLLGVRDIGGRLLLDESAWQGSGSADGFDADAERAFTVAPHTHMLNFKVAWLRYSYDGDRPQVVLDPPLPQFSVLNQLQRDEGSDCGDVRRHAAVAVSGERIVVSGRLPRACHGSASYLNLLDNASFAAQSFIALWQAQGGQGPRGVGRETAPAAARTLLRVESEPLATALVDINKYSNNSMARSVLLTLGAETGGGNTPAAAEQALREQLARHGLPTAPLVVENGAGLSRRERLSARLLGEVLRNALRGRYGAELAASLPLAGEDGTLRRRLGGLPGSLRLKTGSLDEVRALAGYWQAPSGQRLVIVAIVNSARAERLTPALDAAVAELIRRYQARLAAAAAAGL